MKEITLADQRVLNEVKGGALLDLETIVHNVETQYENIAESIQRDVEDILRIH